MPRISTEASVTFCPDVTVQQADLELNRQVRKHLQYNAAMRVCVFEGRARFSVNFCFCGCIRLHEENAW